MQHMLKHIILPCVFTSKRRVALFYMVFALHLNVAWKWGTLTVSMFFVFFLNFRACVFIVFPNRNSCAVNFPWYFPYGFKILFLFRHLCSWRVFLCGNLWYDQWYCKWSLTVRMHVASFVHSNGSSLFTIIHWPWSMNQGLPVLIRVTPINQYQVSVNYFCYHHWTIIKINQVIDQPEIIQCLILQLPAFNTSCHMPWCQRDHLQRSNSRCAVIGEPGSPRVYIYIYTYTCMYIVQHT